RIGQREHLAGLAIAIIRLGGDGPLEPNRTKAPRAHAVLSLHDDARSPSACIAHALRDGLRRRRAAGAGVALVRAPLAFGLVCAAPTRASGLAFPCHHRTPSSFVQSLAICLCASSSRIRPAQTARCTRSSTASLRRASSRGSGHRLAASLLPPSSRLTRWSSS